MICAAECLRTCVTSSSGHSATEPLLYKIFMYRSFLCAFAQHSFVSCQQRKPLLTHESVSTGTNNSRFHPAWPKGPLNSDGNGVAGPDWGHSGDGLPHSFRRALSACFRMRPSLFANSRAYCFLLHSFACCIRLYHRKRVCQEAKNADSVPEVAIFGQISDSFTHCLPPLFSLQ